MARIPKCRCHLLRSHRRSRAWCCISCVSTVIPLSPPGSPANTRRAARSSTWVRNGLRSKRPGFPRLRPLQIVGGPGSRRGRTHRCARVRGGAHGQLPGREGAHRQGKEQRKEGRQEVRGEEGETKEVTLATAFSEK